MKRICLVTAICALLAALLLTSGCANEPKEQKITAWSVRRDMSPEMQTIDDTPEQVWNHIFRSVDTNLRSAQEDVYRVLMIEGPDRMTKLPVP